MKFINTIIIISSVFSFKDYFKNVESMHPQLQEGKDKQYTEELLPENPDNVNDRDGIQILSVAVHGGKIENESDKFAKKLYERVKKDRKKSALYTFNSNINSIQSGSVETKRCTTIQCCKFIRGKDGKSIENKDFGDGKMCKKFKKDEVDVCDKSNVCYLNAAHVTSEFFMTPKLKKVLPSRYPVSFHGFQDKNDTNHMPVDIVMGGLSKQKQALAEKLYSYNPNIRFALCDNDGNCKVYDPSNKPDQRVKFDGSGLTGTAPKNFVNNGKYNCGLQLELSTTFRDSDKTNETHWDNLIEAIASTLPKGKNDMC